MCFQVGSGKKYSFGILALQNQTYIRCSLKTYLPIFRKCETYRNIRKQHSKVAGSKCQSGRNSARRTDFCIKWLQGFFKWREICFIVKDLKDISTKCNVWALLGSGFRQTNCKKTITASCGMPNNHRYMAGMLELESPFVTIIIKDWIKKESSALPGFSQGVSLRAEGYRVQFPVKGPYLSCRFDSQLHRGMCRGNQLMCLCFPASSIPLKINGKSTFRWRFFKKESSVDAKSREKFRSGILTWSYTFLPQAIGKSEEKTSNFILETSNNTLIRWPKFTSPERDRWTLSWSRLL